MNIFLPMAIVIFFENQSIVGMNPHNWLFRATFYIRNTFYA